jgi:predicted aconitase with swiveling domain
MKLRGRVIKEGHAEGEALVSCQPIGFFGGVDPETGVIVEPDHELEGESISGRILVFPQGKGSTVGSYTLYRLRQEGRAPAGIINAQSEAIVAAGAIIADIPMVDRIDISQVRTGDTVTIDGALVEIERAGPGPGEVRC